MPKIKNTAFPIASGARSASKTPVTLPDAASLETELNTTVQTDRTKRTTARAGICTNVTAYPQKEPKSVTAGKSKFRTNSRYTETDNAFFIITPPFRIL